MTPYEKRMKESKQRRHRILRLLKTKSAAQVAALVACTQSYVRQVEKAAREGK